MILLAGKLIAAGISVRSVEGISLKNTSSGEGTIMSGQGVPDIVVECGGTLLSIECKRPLSKDAITRHLRDAHKQLREQGTPGIIAIDCSVSIRPWETILNTSSEEMASEFLIQRLIEKVQPLVDPQFTPAIAGAILYVRAPVHTVHDVSIILSPTGDPITTYRQDTASTLLFIGNASSPNMPAFRYLQKPFT